MPNATEFYLCIYLLSSYYLLEILQLAQNVHAVLCEEVMCN